MRRRRFICAMLAAMMLGSTLCLSGCHGSRNRSSFTVPSLFDETRNFEITFWAKNDTNKTQVQIYRDAISGFEALYPNITVNLRLYTDYGRIYNDVITNISTDTTPNVCITYPDHIATYKTGADVVVPLGSLFEDEKYGLGGSELKFDGPRKEEIVPEFLEECSLDGEYCAVPYMRSTEACYVNRDLVEKLGYELPETLTWDFIWEVSEAAVAEKNPDGTFALNGQKVLIPFIYKSTDNMMISMLRQHGAGYSDDAGNIEIFNDDTAEILRAVAAHSKTGAFSTFRISSYPANFLNAGQCIFAIDSTAGATWMGSDAPLLDISADKIVKFETVVMTIPQYDPENPQMMSQGPSICIFNKADPQEVLASWLFTQYMLTNGVQIAYSQTEGYVPVTLKAQNSDEYLDYLSRAGEDSDFYYDIKIKAAKLLLDNTENTFTTPVFNGSASLRDAAGQMIENVAKSVRRKETVDDSYIERLYSEMNSLYRLDQHSAGETREKLGPLPGTAVALLTGLAAAWLLIGAYFIFNIARKRKLW